MGVSHSDIIYVAGRLVEVWLAYLVAVIVSYHVFDIISRLNI